MAMLSIGFLYYSIYFLFTYLLIPTHKRFKRMLFTRPKHNVRIFGVIPFIALCFVLINSGLLNPVCVCVLF